MLELKSKANGTNLDADQEIEPVNLWLHSLFSQVEIYLNNKLVIMSSTAYPYTEHI